MGRLFGTDGIRGIANKELTAELAMKIGRAAAMILTEKMKNKPKVLIGSDTRISSDMLESAIAAGLCSVGADVLIVGVLPTPAVAYLVKKYSYDAGIMISASHNPCEYNGIKIFQSNGYKLPDYLEEEIESIILDETKSIPLRIAGDVGKIIISKNAVSDYIEHLIKTTDERNCELKIALDCANGSSSITAKKIFKSIGADCIVINDKPNGININKNCGSTHLENLIKVVKSNNCDLGFAFDGDADRLLCVDENGTIVDGDKIIAICSKFMKERSLLKNDTVVITVMSNLGFHKFCEKNNIKCEITKVGDRYVLENMTKNNYKIGGEQSGHIIFLDYSTTGDGQLTALQILKVMKETGKSLKELASEMEVYPQVLINVKVSAYGKSHFEHDEEIKRMIDNISKQLSSDGRILVRVSGTEPLIRIMLEGKNIDLITKLGNEVSNVIKERLL